MGMPDAVEIYALRLSGVSSMNKGKFEGSAQAENKIGFMLPCNVIVQETDSRQIEIAAIDPMATIAAVGNDALLLIAKEVSKILKNTINSI